eukprot:873114-Prorocentrum_minimum.AAC.1
MHELTPSEHEFAPSEHEFAPSEHEFTPSTADCPLQVHGLLNPPPLSMNFPPLSMHSPPLSMHSPPLPQIALYKYMDYMGYIPHVQYMDETELEPMFLSESERA